MTWWSSISRWELRLTRPLDGWDPLSWERWRYSTTSTYDLNFQVKFFDNGNIEFHYGDMNASTTTNTIMKVGVVPSQRSTR